jgi:hypothetical protein
MDRSLTLCFIELYYFKISFLVFNRQKNSQKRRFQLISDFSVNSDELKNNLSKLQGLGTKRGYNGLITYFSQNPID